jgi:hypothetical protein
MTEAEWNSCTDPQAMLAFLRYAGRLSDRKARLFGVACCRRIWHLLSDERSRRAVEVAERFADGQVMKDELQAAYALAFYAADAPKYPGDEGVRIDIPEADALAYAAASAADDAVIFADAAAASVRYARDDEGEAQAALLHDIFNPWPSASVDAFRTPPVLALAQAAYDDRLLPSGELDPARLAALAAALAAAGCTDAELLAHLRSPGLHCRGCWALDSLLSRG